jgi:MYXO-CTERM domain-containing protein
MPQPEALDTDEPGALQGELAVYIADFDDGTAETRYFLRDAQGVEQRLAVTGELEAAPGRKLKIWGKQRGDVLEVARYKVVEERAGEGIGSQGQAVQPLIDAAPRPGRVLCAAVVGVNGTGKVTVAQTKASFHEGATSVDAYYRENSFGQVGLDGDTFGPFTHSMSSCDYSGLAKAVKPMIDSANTGAKCQQYAFVMGPNVSSCGWSGLGQVGSPDKPASDTWYNDSVSCVVAVQEPGHNYGGRHSSAITCSGSPGGFADNLSSCQHSEYGDKFDTMGGGCYHMNAWQKLYQKWFGGCNGVKATSSGKFTLYPIESPCNGVQAIQLPFPGGKTRSFDGATLTSYYLELRTAVGFDAKYGAPSVLLHASGNPILPTQSNPQGMKTWVIAAGGASAAQWGLKAGQSFADPGGGLTITVESISTTAPVNAVIDVKYDSGSGGPVCLNGANTPFDTSVPQDCNAPVPDAGGTGGTGGTGGAGGKGGTGGTGGSKDAGTTGGTGGATGGTGGTGGATGGSAGTGGATGGTGGTGGATGGTGGATGGTGGTTGGTGGTGGTTGGAGGGKAGAGGVGGTTGGSAGRGGDGGTRPPADDPGCGCRITPEPVQGGATGGLLALGLGALFTARRRNRRKSDS